MADRHRLARERARIFAQRLLNQRELAAAAAARRISTDLIWKAQIWGENPPVRIGGLPC